MVKGDKVDEVYEKSMKFAQRAVAYTIDRASIKYTLEEVR
jgi:hypothetical protein